GGPKFAAKPHNPGFGMGGPMHNEVPPPPNLRGRGRGGNIRGRGRGRGFGGANHGGYMNAGAGYGSYGYGGNSATAGYMTKTISPHLNPEKPAFFLITSMLKRWEHVGNCILR
ncbi:ILF3 isoform 11, partial [Pongo abelii]